MEGGRGGIDVVGDRERNRFDKKGKSGVFDKEERKRSVRRC